MSAIWHEHGQPSLAVAIIPARGGSKRIPRKNIRHFHGKPIIAYSIEAAARSGLFDGIYVSTEDAEIADVANLTGAEVIVRPPELAEIDASDCGTQEVARHALTVIGRVEFACCIYATAPLLDPVDLGRGFAVLHKARSAFSYAVGRAVDGVEEDAGQFYWGHAWAFLSRVPLYEFGTSVKIGRHRFCDINTEEDWKRAEEMYAALHRETA